MQKYVYEVVTIVNNSGALQQQCIEFDVIKPNKSVVFIDWRC